MARPGKNRAHGASTAPMQHLDCVEPSPVVPEHPRRSSLWHGQTGASE